MSYDQNLRALKASFRGGGEGAFYFKTLEHLTNPHIDWLDIGIGRDGAALEPFVDFCVNRGQTLSITGIDPDVAGPRQDNASVSWTLVRGGFEDWCTDALFDIVNADQSLYYMADLRSQLSRAIDLVRPMGLFVATCWLEDDALHRLRQKLFTNPETDLTGEQLAALIEDDQRLDVVDAATFETEVDFDHWREDHARLEAAVRIVARAAPINDVECLAPSAGASFGRHACDRTAAKFRHLRAQAIVFCIYKRWSPKSGQ